MFLALLVVSGNGCWVPLLVSMVTPPVVVMVLGVFPVLPPLLPVPRGFFPDVDPVFPHHRQRPLVDKIVKFSKKLFLSLITRGPHQSLNFAPQKLFT